MHRMTPAVKRYLYSYSGIVGEREVYKEEQDVLKGQNGGSKRHTVRKSLEEPLLERIPYK